MLSIFNTLEKFFPGYEVAVTGMDDDERRATVRVYGDRTRGGSYLFDGNPCSSISCMPMKSCSRKRTATSGSITEARA